MTGATQRHPRPAPCSLDGGSGVQLESLRRHCQTPPVSLSRETQPEYPISAEQVAAITRVLAEPRRFAILQQIAGNGEMACASLDVRECISPATISHHLKELQSVGLVSVEREGRGMRLKFERPLWQAYLRELGSL